MADNTRAGIIGIVVIVAIVAVFMIVYPMQNYATATSESGNLAGKAYQTTVSTQNSADGSSKLGSDSSEESCNPGRFCDGSKLIIVREDCSVAQAFCQEGCNKQLKTCS